MLAVPFGGPIPFLSETLLIDHEETNTGNDGRLDFVHIICSALKEFATELANMIIYSNNTMTRLAVGEMGRRRVLNHGAMWDSKYLFSI